MSQYGCPDGYLKQHEKNGSSVTDAIKRTQRHIRNNNANDLDEPEGFASGDMEKFLENTEECEKEEDDEQKENKQTAEQEKQVQPMSGEVDPKNVEAEVFGC